MPGDASACLFNIRTDARFLLGYLNSSVVQEALNILNPTLNYPTGTIASVPFSLPNEISVIARCGDIVDSCIEVSRQDWNCSETSWDFVSHPLV